MHSRSSSVRPCQSWVSNLHISTWSIEEGRIPCRDGGDQRGERQQRSWPQSYGQVEQVRPGSNVWRVRVTQSQRVISLHTNLTIAHHFLSGSAEVSPPPAPPADAPWVGTPPAASLGSDGGARGRRLLITVTTRLTEGRGPAAAGAAAAGAAEEVAAEAGPAADIRDEEEMGAAWVGPGASAALMALMCSCLSSVTAST